MIESGQYHPDLQGKTSSDKLELSVQAEDRVEADNQSMGTLFQSTLESAKAYFQPGSRPAGESPGAFNRGAGPGASNNLIKLGPVRPL